MSTKIEWADCVWNPVVGCTKVSSGCANCYAASMAAREMSPQHVGLTRRVGKAADWVAGVRLVRTKLSDPLLWRKPRRVFVNSMSDLFHEDVPDWFIGEILDVIGKAREHTFLVLTKRPARMMDLLSTRSYCSAFARQVSGVLPNLWLGVSVEDQAAADARIPLLLQTPAAVRFVSCEPLLGPIDFTQAMYGPEPQGMNCFGFTDGFGYEVGIQWVIVGGESGPRARPMHPAWARSIRDQCQAARVPFFFKQWGEHGYAGQVSDEVWSEWDASPEGAPRNEEAPYKIGKRRAGRLLDGREWNEIPEVSR